MDPEEPPLHVFKWDKPSFGLLTGGVSKEQLVTELMKIENFSFPSTFPKAMAMLRAKGNLNPEEILTSRLETLKITQFPAFKLSVLPTGSIRKVLWKKHECWTIADVADVTLTGTKSVPAITGDVFLNIQSLGLIYDSQKESIDLMFGC